MKKGRLRLPWPAGKRRQSCSKHGPYDGPYCCVCFEKAMGSESESKPVVSNKNWNIANNRPVFGMLQVEPSHRLNDAVDYWKDLQILVKMEGAFSRGAVNHFGSVL